MYVLIYKMLTLFMCVVGLWQEASIRNRTNLVSKMSPYLLFHVQLIDFIGSEICQKRPYQTSLLSGFNGNLLEEVNCKTNVENDLSISDVLTKALLLKYVAALTGSMNFSSVLCITMHKPTQRTKANIQNLNPLTIEYHAVTVCDVTLL